MSPRTASRWTDQVPNRRRPPAVSHLLGLPPNPCLSTLPRRHTPKYGTCTRDGHLLQFNRRWCRIPPSKSTEKTYESPLAPRKPGTGQLAHIAAINAHARRPDEVQGSGERQVHAAGLCWGQLPSAPPHMAALRRSAMASWLLVREDRYDTMSRSCRLSLKILSKTSGRMRGTLASVSAILRPTS